LVILNRIKVNRYDTNFSFLLLVHQKLAEISNCQSLKDYTKYSDADLVMFVRKNDHHAFTEIYNRYWKKLLLSAYHRIRHYQDSQEIVQHIFIDIWKRRESWQLSYSLSSYLFAAVKYQVINFFALRAGTLRSQKLAEEYPMNNSSHRIDLQELQSEVSSVIEGLPEKCRLVFRLSREHEYTHKRIALELGIAEKTVQAHISLALRRLKTALGSF